MVLQDNLLFNRTIHDNIALANPAMPRAQVMAVARLAGADEFIGKLPQGYDTMIEERGANLSGGQRQRIAIARALATNPPILIFDEATSALDYESERIIQRNMRQIVQGRTVFIIAHRLAAVRDCDVIIGMIDGRLVEAGTPCRTAEKPAGPLCAPMGDAERRRRVHERGQGRSCAAAGAEKCNRSPFVADREFLPADLEILETPPSPVRMALILIICALVVAALAWSWFGRIDIVAVAQGKIQPTGRVKVIQPLETGKIAAIKVENGQQVKAGEVLLEMERGRCRRRGSRRPGRLRRLSRRGRCAARAALEAAQPAHG